MAKTNMNKYSSERCWWEGDISEGKCIRGCIYLCKYYQNVYKIQNINILQIPMVINIIIISA